jgi:ADP-ribosylglycohydrolase
MKLKTPTADRRHGVMFGLAYGDALGRPTEFLKATSLKKFGSPFQKRVGLNKTHQGIVTDDTQMSIAVARAALTHGHPNINDQTERFVTQFIRWQNDPKSRDGQRAPGATCMTAVSALQRNPAQWLLATRPDSKGNGANMRVSPLALRTDWTWDELGGAAQLQAAITHGHPTALASAELTAVAVRMLLEGIAQPTENLVDHLLAYAYDQRDKYRGAWLGHLWQSARPAPVYAPRLQWWEDAQPAAFRPTARTVKPPTSPLVFIRRGWDEMIDALLSIYRMERNPEQDPCDVAGGGWVGEEALAASLHTLLCFPGDPTNALRRAAFTDGDSDSIASITGALAGAAYGLKAFPAHWIGNLEYRTELEGLTGKLTAAARPC